MRNTVTPSGIHGFRALLANQSSGVRVTVTFRTVVPIRKLAERTVWQILALRRRGELIAEVAT